MSRFADFDLACAIAAVPERQALELTFAELCDAFEAAFPCATSTRLRKWRAAFGQRSAWEVTRDEFVRAADAMKMAGYSAASVNRDLSTVGTMFRWAHEVRKITPPNFRSPTLDIRRSEEAMRVVTLTPSEQSRLRKLALAFPDRRFGLFVHLMLDSGARPNEVLSRKWNELNTVTLEVLLPAETVKTKRARILHFTQSTGVLIDRLRPAKPLQDSLVFIGRKGGIIDFRKAWKQLTRMLGRPDLHVYDLRHVAAANLLNSGVSLAVAAQVLGNSSLVLHRRYGHLDRDSLRRAQQVSWVARDAVVPEPTPQLAVSP